MPTVKYRTVIQWEADVETGTSRVLRQFTMVDSGVKAKPKKKEPKQLISDYGETLEM